MTVDELDDTTCIASLRDTICPACGQDKERGHTMCKRCYYRLHESLRMQLYHRVGKGYREAVQTAMRALGVNEPIVG